MLVDELVSKFFWAYKFKDEKTQAVIAQQARLLHDNNVDTVESDVAVLALHHLLFKTPDDYWKKMRTLPENDSKGAK
jgi:hypothetical protein